MQTESPDAPSRGPSKRAAKKRRRHFPTVWTSRRPPRRPSQSARPSPAARASTATGLDTRATQDDATRTPITDELTHITEEATPVTDEMTCITDEATPITDEMTCITDETTPIADERTRIADETTPIADETTRIADETTPIAEETTRIADEMTQYNRPGRLRQLAPGSHQWYAALHHRWAKTSRMACASSRPEVTARRRSFGGSTTRVHRIVTELETALRSDAPRTHELATPPRWRTRDDEILQNGSDCLRTSDSGH